MWKSEFIKDQEKWILKFCRPCIWLSLCILNHKNLPTYSIFSDSDFLSYKPNASPAGDYCCGLLSTVTYRDFLTGIFDIMWQICPLDSLPSSVNQVLFIKVEKFTLQFACWGLMDYNYDQLVVSSFPAVWASIWKKKKIYNVCWPWKWSLNK